MLGWINFLKPKKVCCYFITGTGRCGTMLFARLLSLSSNSHCDHERSIRYSKMKPAYLSGNMAPLYEEIGSIIKPQVKTYNKKGLTYGESSGLLYLAFKELYRRYGTKTRFILLTRHPEGFVRSALARGFFDPCHPNSLEHLRAKPNTAIGNRWKKTGPFEKCLWYWDLVNSMICDFFSSLPSELWKIQPIEKLNIEVCRELYQFLELDGFNKKEVKELLSTRVNATPNGGDHRSLNPWSLHMKIGDRSTWDQDQNFAYETWAVPLAKKLYPDEESNEFLDTLPT